MSVIVLTKVEEVKEFLASGGLNLLYVGMQGCRPCSFYVKNFEDASNNVSDSCRFAKVIVNEVPDVNDVLGVTSVPTTIVIKDGKELHRAIGLLQTEEILELILEFKNK